MKRKLVITIFIVIIVIALTSIGTVTYAWLTDKTAANEDIKLTINNSKIEGQFNYSSSATPGVIYGVEDAIQINDLAYIDIEKDFITNEYNTLNSMASVITVSIESTSTVDTKAWIELSKIKDIETNLYSGYIYLVVLPSDLGANLTYADIVNSIVINKNLTSSNGTNIINSHQSAIAAVEEYNYNKLKSIYEDSTIAMMTNDTPSTFTFDIVLWGDYYGLSSSDQALNTHLTKSFDLTISTYITQLRSGGASYEEDRIN